jgi:hypothetical protein
VAFVSFTSRKPWWLLGIITDNLQISKAMSDLYGLKTRKYVFLIKLCTNKQCYILLTNCLMDHHNRVNGDSPVKSCKICITFIATYLGQVNIHFDKPIVTPISPNTSGYFSIVLQ